MTDTVKRQTGLPGAALPPLGSTFGAGVFVIIGLAANMTGQWVLPAILLAALVAGCNRPRSSRDLPHN